MHPRSFLVLDTLLLSAAQNISSNPWSCFGIHPGIVEENYATYMV